MKKILVLAILALTLLIPTSVMAANPLPMTTTTVAQTVSIAVDVQSLNFGTVVVGTDSAAIPIVITNTGNVPITVTVIVSGSDASFYNSSLYMNSGSGYTPVGSWSYTTAIPVGGTLPISLKVHPSVVGTGFAGTLTFVGTASL